MLQIGHVELDSNLLLAPIARYTDLAFRLVVRPLGGVGLACTELVNPRGLLRQTWKSMEIVHSEPADRPLCMQLYGAEAGPMADAARWCVDHEADIVDINMGCPVDKVVKRGGGAALLKDPARAVRLLERVVQSTAAPVTAKLRLGWDPSSIVAPKLARDLESAGAAAVIVHGRTADQEYRGEVDLDAIGEVVAAVRDVPVIGNGNVRSPEEAWRMIEHTGCAGVMIGRAALGDPWIFPQTRSYLDTGVVSSEPTRDERIDLMGAHFRELLRIRGSHRGCLSFRQRITWYLRKIGPSREFVRRMHHLKDPDEYFRLVERYLRNEATFDRPACASVEART
jgi:nifR3 family TIM-barrel protein